MDLERRRKGWTAGRWPDRFVRRSAPARVHSLTAADLDIVGRVRIVAARDRVVGSDSIVVRTRIAVALAVVLVVDTTVGRSLAERIAVRQPSSTVWQWVD